MSITEVVLYVYSSTCMNMDCKWPTVELFIATLVTVGLHVGGVIGSLTCFTCENYHSSHDCKTFTTCSDGQLCYKELTLVASGQYVHNKGCAPKELCDLSGANIKRSGLQVCFHCCDHHFCNFEKCQKDFCLSNPCRNNATCVNMDLHFKCTCQPGYTGEQCTTEIDNCASNPCQNFGTCQNFVNGYHCNCLPGFTGYNCETDVNECLSNPCMHGNCSDRINNFVCSCNPGYTGKICDMDINECSSGPCVNGRCEDRVNSFVCHCTRGYMGQHCEQQIDECASSPCQHGCVCVDLVGEYGCGCKAGFRGVNCETNIDECASNPCQNNATCFDMISGYQCACRPGFSGIHCQVDIDECSSNPCQNDGWCVDMINGYNCSCLPGFSGIRCQVDVNECTSSPCQHHGTCVDMINGYNCSCPPGFSGIHCEVDINECASAPCHNGGKCVDKVNGYSCMCDMGFEGINCEIELGRRCYTCENESHAGNCTNRTICKAEEKCYIQHELVSAGVFSFNLGCVPKTLCSMMETLGGKRSSHYIQLCYECCDVNDCNRYACASSQFAEECFEHHCLHNGTCIARNGKPFCKCPDGFRGEHCEIDTPLICYGCGYTTSHASCNFLRRCQWGSACFIGRTHGGHGFTMECMDELACYDADKATHEGKLYTSHGTDYELATCCTDNKCNFYLD